jgi:LEA14-like dessication related protein
MTPFRPTRRASLRWLSLSLVAGAPMATGLGGCAALPQRDPMRVDLAGIDTLPGEGIELRFLVRLRVQNPNEVEIAYDGLSFEIDLRGASFASGVSAEAGSIGRYGEKVIAIPVTVSGLAMARQIYGLAKASDSGTAGKLPYVMRGKLGGGMFGSVRFETRGEVHLGHHTGG